MDHAAGNSRHLSLENLLASHRGELRPKAAEVQNPRLSRAPLNGNPAAWGSCYNSNFKTLKKGRWISDTIIRERRSGTAYGNDSGFEPPRCEAMQIPQRRMPRIPRLTRSSKFPAGGYPASLYNCSAAFSSSGLKILIDGKLTWSYHHRSGFVFVWQYVILFLCQGPMLKKQIQI